MVSGATGFDLPASAGVSDCYSHAWKQLKRAFIPLLIVWLVSVVLSAVISGVGAGIGGVLDGMMDSESATFSSLLSGLLQLLVGTPLSVGTAYVFLRAARGETPQVNDLFAAFRSTNIWFSSIATIFLMGIIIGIGYVLLIIPGIFLTIKLSFAIFLVVDENLGPMAALRESWRRTAGHAWSIVGIALLAIPISIVGFILLLVGIIPASMLVALAFASIYVASESARAQASPAVSMA